MEKTNSESYSAIIDSPLGKLGIKCESQKVTQIEFLSAKSQTQEPTDPFTQKVIRELKQYFKNPNFHFSVAVNAVGTSYKQHVWQLLKNIPTGKTKSYGDVAFLLNSN